MSPTARAKAYCKKKGWPCCVVERWNPFAKVRQDLFGFIDIIVLADLKLIGVQATSRGNHNARILKSRESEYLRPWLRAGGAFEVWSYDSKKLKTKEGIRFKSTSLLLAKDGFNEKDVEEII